MSADIVLACPAERREVEPDYQPECTHPEHWQDPPAGWVWSWDDPVPACRWRQRHATCGLEDGHAGPHEWEPSGATWLPVVDA